MEESYKATGVEAADLDIENRVRRLEMQKQQLPEYFNSERDYRLWVTSIIERRLSRRFEDYMEYRIRRLLE